MTANFARLARLALGLILVVLLPQIVSAAARKAPPKSYKVIAKPRPAAARKAPLKRKTALTRKEEPKAPAKSETPSKPTASKPEPKSDPKPEPKTSPSPSPSPAPTAPVTPTTPTTPPVTTAPAAPTTPEGEQNPDPFVIKQKILNAGVPAASLGRILAFIDKNADQEMDLKAYFCKDPKTKEFDENNIAPCSLDEAEIGVRKITLKRPRYVGVVDFSLPSTENRFFLIDLMTGDVQRFEAAHGKGSGKGKWAYKFSNKLNSDQSALGLYYLQGLYYGHKGPTMRLYGLESSNDAAYSRDIVLHGAWYARDSYAKSAGRLGLSWGCPAVAPEVQAKIIPLLKDGAIIDLYHPELMDLALSGQEVSIPEPAN